MPYRCIGQTERDVIRHVVSPPSAVPGSSMVSLPRFCGVDEMRQAGV